MDELQKIVSQIRDDFYPDINGQRKRPKLEEPEDLNVFDHAADIGKSVAAGAVSLGTGLARGAEWLGSESAGDVADSMDEFTQEHLSPKQGGFSRDIASGVGSLVPTLIIGLLTGGTAAAAARGLGMVGKADKAAKLFKIAGVTASTGMEALGEAGHVFEDAQRNGKSVEEAGNAATKAFMMNAALIGGTSYAGGFYDIGKKAGLFRKGLKETAEDVAKKGSQKVSLLRRGLTGAASEGLQETGQSMISQGTATGEIDMKEAFYEGGIGAIVGGGTGMGLQALKNKYSPDTDNNTPTATADERLDQINSGELEPATYNRNDNPLETYNTRLEADPAAFNSGVSPDDVEVMQDEVGRRNLVEQQMQENQAAIDEMYAEQNEAELQDIFRESYEMEQAQNAYQEEINRNEAIENQKYMDAISDKNGALQIAGNIYHMAEKTGDPALKQVGKTFYDARENILLSNPNQNSLEKLQIKLSDIAQHSKDQRISALANALQPHVDQRIQDIIQSQNVAQQERSKPTQVNQSTAKGNAAREAMALQKRKEARAKEMAAQKKQNILKEQQAAVKAANREKNPQVPQPQKNPEDIEFQKWEQKSGRTGSARPAISDAGKAWERYKADRARKIAEDNAALDERLQQEPKRSDRIVPEQKGTSATKPHDLKPLTPEQKKALQEKQQAEKEGAKVQAKRAEQKLNEPLQENPEDAKLQVSGQVKGRVSGKGMTLQQLQESKRQQTAQENQEFREWEQKAKSPAAARRLENAAPENRKPVKPQQMTQEQIQSLNTREQNAKAEARQKAAELPKKLNEPMKQNPEDVGLQIPNQAKGRVTGNGKSLRQYIDDRQAQIKQENEEFRNWEKQSKLARYMRGKQKEQIRDIIRQTKKNKGKYRWVAYQTVKPEVAKKIKEITGKDVNGYKHLIDNNTINHIINRHGDPAVESSRSNRPGYVQVPITEEDFTLLPDIVSSPDSIQLAEEKEHYKKKDVVSIEYEKRFNGHLLLVEEVRTGRGKLAVTSLWKWVASAKDVTHRKTGYPPSESSETLRSQPTARITPAKDVPSGGTESPPSPTSETFRGPSAKATTPDAPSRRKSSAQTSETFRGARISPADTDSKGAPLSTSETDRSPSHNNSIKSDASPVKKDPVKYLREKKKTREIKTLTNRIKLNLRNVRVHTHKNPADLRHGEHNYLYEQINSDGAHDAKALYDPNTKEIHLFEDNVESVQEAQEAVWHELGHYSLQDLFGKKVDPLLKRIQKSYKNEIDDRCQRYYGEFATEQQRMREAEEFLIERFEMGEQVTVMDQLKLLFVKLARIFNKGNITDVEMKALASRIRNNLDINLDSGGKHFNLDQKYLVDPKTEDTITARTAINEFFKMHDQTSHNIDVLTKMLEQEFYELTGSKNILKQHDRTMRSDIMQQALYLYMDMKGKESKIVEYKNEIKARLSKEGLKGAEKTRLNDQLEVIEAFEKLTPEQKNFADTKLRKLFNSSFETARKHGVVHSYEENYIRRLWNVPENKKTNLSGAPPGHTLKTFSTADMSRTLDSVIDGWREGYDLRVSGALTALNHYMQEINHVIANKEFKKYGLSVKDLGGNSMFTTSPKNGYKRLEADGFQIYRPKQKIHIEGPALTEVSINGKMEKVFMNDPKEMFTAHRIQKDGTVKARATRRFTSHEEAKAFVAKSKNKYQIKHKTDITQYQKVDLYAPAGIADIINRMTAKDTFFSESPVLKEIMAFNAKTKGWILSVSLFHYIAGCRSWYFGVHKGRKYSLKSGLNPWIAHKMGLEKIDSLAPVIQLGVRNGLTLGKVQDFDAQLAASSKSIFEQMAIRSGNRNALKFVRGAKLLREKFTNHMFGRFFAGLKAEAFSIEFAHEMRRCDADLKAGKITEDQVAEKVGRMINADFGGLHLGRMGRHPTVQNFLRVLLLAPDWTESNFRTVTGMVPGLNKLIGKTFKETPPPPGMEKLYRRFWTGIAVKTVAATALAQIAMATIPGGGDDDDSTFDFYRKQFSSTDQIKKLRWTGVNITKLYNMLGIDTHGHDKVFSLAGHFVDPLKLFDPMKLMKGKQSPVARVGEQLYTGSDWAERPFTGITEYMKTGETVKKSRFHEKETFFNRLPSTIINSVTAMQPIVLQEVFRAATGEEDPLTSMLKATGMHVSNAYDVNLAKLKYNDIKSDINSLKSDLKNAKAMRDPERIRKARKAERNYPKYTQITFALKAAEKQLKDIRKRLNRLKLIKREKGKLSNLEKQLEARLKKRESQIMTNFLRRIGEDV